MRPGRQDDMGVRPAAPGSADPAPQQDVGVGPAAPGSADPVPQQDVGVGPAAPGGAVRNQRVALVDLLDRVLATGVVITGDVTLSIAEVDLVTISLRALVSSVGGTGLVPGLHEEGGEQ